MKGYIWGEKCLKIKGMMGMTVQNWSSSKVCCWFWLSHVVLWKHAGQIPYGKQGRQELLLPCAKVALTAPAGQLEIMLCYWHPPLRLLLLQILLWVSLRNTVRIHLPCPSHVLFFFRLCWVLCFPVWLRLLCSLLSFSNHFVTIYLPSHE